MLPFTAAAIAASFFGTRISPTALTRSFAVVLIGVAVFVAAETATVIRVSPTAARSASSCPATSGPAASNGSPPSPSSTPPPTTTSRPAPFAFCRPTPNLDTIAPGDGIPLSTLALSCDVLTPHDRDHLPAGPLTLSGYAQPANGRRIARVDVSTDGGSTWSQADIDSPYGP